MADDEVTAGAVLEADAERVEPLGDAANEIIDAETVCKMETRTDTTAEATPGDSALLEALLEGAPLAAINSTKTTSPVSLPQQSAVRDKKLVFNELPRDIKLAVIEKVLRPSDLKNVCLVNKEFHQLAVRFLYNSVSLDLGCKNDNKLSAFLNPQNPGLQYVRQLRLYLAQTKDRCPRLDQQADFATRILLDFLPEDVLEEFSWCPWKPFSTENLLLLYRKQRRLKWLEVMDLQRDVLPELKKQPKLQKQVFAHARKLALYPENRDTLALSGFFVEQLASRLEELIVHCNFHESRSPIRAQELNDSATGPGLLTRSIFGHMQPFDKPFEHLTSLRLHRINLRHCADTWCKFVNFQQIQYLRVYHCPGADSLFGQMSRAAHLPKKLDFLEIQHQDNSENEALMAIDGFLCLVAGVRVMVVDLDRVKAMLSAACITKHQKTLELLNVHCHPDPRDPPSDNLGHEELVWTIEDFEKICMACTNLEQFSCAWPKTFLLKTPTGEWRGFEAACALLHKLVTLHITSWPQTTPSVPLLPRFAYEQALQGLAQRGFELAAGVHSSQTGIPIPSDPDDDVESDPGDAGMPGIDDMDLAALDVMPSAKLRIIAFGVSDKIYERQESSNQLLYLRSTCVDADGKTRPYAAPLSWNTRQFIEPRSEVLEFVLHRGDADTGPPCLGEKAGWDDDE